MVFDKIRRELASQIIERSEWPDKLNDSNPGHYGLEDWSVQLREEDIWVDLPQRTFTFKNATFDFEVLLGSSNEEDGTKMNFSKQAKGSGTFNFSGDKVTILEIEIDFDLDLFGED